LLGKHVAKGSSQHHLRRGLLARQGVGTWEGCKGEVRSPVRKRLRPVRLHTSGDGGVTWHRAHLAGPFDQTTAPTIRYELDGEGGGFLGDVQGIAPLPRGFATAFTLAALLPGADFTLSNPPTDIFFSRSDRP